MKRLLTIGLLLILLLAAVALGRALLVEATPQTGAALPATDIDVNLVAQHLSDALRFQTISLGGGLGEDARRVATMELRAWLESTYPAFHRVAGREDIGESLLFTWMGRNATLPPVLLMAHMDVVPVVPGTENDWAHQPFSGDIADDHVWGRGAIDDKGSLVCLFEAVERLAASDFTPARTVMIAVGHDEEVGGSRGNQMIAKSLQSRGVRFDWVLDEGGAVANDPLPGLRRRLAVVSIAEKGYVSLQLIARGDGGHSSRPTPDLAIPRLARALDNVMAHPFASGLDEIQREKVEVLARMVPFRTRLALANLWLTSPFVTREMEATPDGAARLHTTIAPTMLTAGVKENVLPPSASAVINFRIHPRDTIERITAHVREAVNDPQVQIQVLEETQAEASPVSDFRGPAFERVVQAIHAAFGPIPVAPDIMVAASDSRHYVPIAGNVFRFMPFALDRADLPRIHGTNERVAVESLGPAVRFYETLVKEMK